MNMAPPFCNLKIERLVLGRRAMTNIFIMRFCAIVLILSSSVLPNLAASGSEDIIWWCSKTPHPQACNYYMSGGGENSCSPPKDRSEFRKMVIEVSIKQALDAQGQVLQLGTKCETNKQKSAWNDCSELYGDIILQLNRTLQCLQSNNDSHIDAQTWLSTSLTDIETCKMGFQDLNVLDFISPTMSSNLSQLISNGLAVNGDMLESGEQQGVFREERFPRWFSTHDRKLLQSSSLASKANVVVAKDGSGHFRTIKAAINLAAKRRSMSKRYIIYVKKGVYKENIVVGNNNNNLMLIGDGMRYTIITGSRSVGEGYTTYSSATAGIDGFNFVARDITFSNTAGPQKGQAVALRSASDLSVFYRCRIQGYQDTLWVHSQRQFYKACYIYGTIDFIFGNAAVVFQNCIIYARKPIHGQANVITAQGRNDPYQNTGIVIHNSRVVADPTLAPLVSSVETYLGRPWMQYSRTVYMKTYLGSLVTPAGWSTWDGSNFALRTLYYGEYNNFGPGSSTAKRVKWGGYHVIKSPTTASRFTVGRFIAGQSWLPAAGVPFTSNL